tara:strand:- start:182 stop:784 length:603 start_codon:yes stop_codon:yes gene_type:complete
MSEEEWTTDRIDMTPPQPVIIPKGILENKTFEDYFWRWYGFVIPDKQAIEIIKHFTEGLSILEIGAGTGLFAKLLQNNDVDITPTDLLPPIYTKNWYRRFWTDVESLDAIEAVEKYTDVDALMVVWPHLDEVWCKALQKYKGDKLIYVGDSAPDDFHKELEKNWEFVLNKEMNTFPTNHHFTEHELKTPTLHLLKRKEKE